jgi:DnaJ-class molecular chaperone
LSREKHPDKNPDNPEAVAEFIQITKAYTIMTDEKAR